MFPLLSLLAVCLVPYEKSMTPECYSCLWLKYCNVDQLQSKIGNRNVEIKIQAMGVYVLI